MNIIVLTILKLDTLLVDNAVFSSYVMMPGLMVFSSIQVGPQLSFSSLQVNEVTGIVEKVR